MLYNDLLEKHRREREKMRARHAEEEQNLRLKQWKQKSELANKALRECGGIAEAAGRKLQCSPNTIRLYRS